MYRFKFTLFALFVSGLLLITACKEQAEQLPIKKIAKKSWKIAKKGTKQKKELRYEGPHNFYEYHHRIRTRTGDLKPRYTTNYKQAAFQKALRLNKQQGIARNKKLDWEERGPGNVGGRTRGILVDKRDETYLTWLVGSAGGGIWKTTDGGQNFTLTTEELPNMSTTTLAASDANPDIVYAGTGEGIDGQMIEGDGIYKSLDAGESWSVLPVTANNQQFENVLRLVVDPENPNIVLAATRRSYRIPADDNNDLLTNGYIMKSEDGGVSWREVFSVEGNPRRAFSQAVQQIVADPSDFNILYATARNYGVLKSTDKGETWVRVFNAARDNFGRMELAVSPVNPQVLHFATEANGEANLIRSSNGGATWGAITGEFGNWFGGQGWYDNTIAGHPFDENQILVGGAGPLLSITSSGDSVGVTILGEIINETQFINLYNPDGGAAVLTIADFYTEFLGLPAPEVTEDLVPIEIRFGSGITQKAHRHFADGNIENTYLDYVEVPFQVWDVLADKQLMVSFNDADNNGAWSINEVGEELDPENSNEILIIHSLDYDANQPSAELNDVLNKAIYAVFAGTFKGAELGTQALPTAKIAIRTSTKTSLGSSFENIADGYGQYGGSSKGVHVDHHNLTLIPIDEATGTFYIINGNDGGIAFSKDSGETFVQTGDTFKEERNFDGTTTIFETTLGYNTSQFYGVDKMNGEDRYIGGTQDNGSFVSPANPGTRSVWVLAPSGDGFEAAWNYENPDLLLESSQFNNVFRSDDRGETWNNVDMPGSGPFVTRIAASKQDPDLVFGISSLGVLKSTDFGLNWSVTEMPDEWLFGNNSIEVSEASPQIVWTGSAFNDFEKMVVSTDGGSSFTPTNGYDQAVLGDITGIGTHPLNKNKAYALFSIADGPKILETSDMGATWRDLSGFVTNQSQSNNGFPDVATFSLVVMPHDTNQIWVGTEIGLFESLDGGASWNYADNGLPPVHIYEMKVVNDEVVIATHGRGIWSVSIPELEGYEPLPALISPQVNVTGTGFNGQIVGEANLRAAYDSTILEIFLPTEEGAILLDRRVLEGNGVRTNVPFELQVDLASDTIIAADIVLSAYSEGEVLVSSGTALIYDVDEAPVTTYSNDFDTDQSDFARLGFNVFQAPNFDSKALHSPHPYPGNNQEFIAVFQKPIIVADSSTLLTFDEVVLVEIGDSPNFGNEFFYDFVTVEATNDNGQTWITLDGYDSSREDIWTTAYELGITGGSELILSNQIGLSGFFEEGDVVYLRFRLVSDPLVEGWGWMIDNIELKSQVTAVEELPETVALKNFPNPFTSSTILQYTLTEKSEVSAALYSLDGKEVSSLIQTTQNAGQHTYEVNTSSLESGMYLCRFQVNGAEQTLKWVKK